MRGVVAIPKRRSGQGTFLVRASGSTPALTDEQKQEARRKLAANRRVLEKGTHMSKASVVTTRQRKVLDLKSQEGESVAVYDNPESESDDTVMCISAEAYEALGSPQHLTVAIWPGDRQDLMESEEFPA